MGTDEPGAGVGMCEQMGAEWRGPGVLPLLRVSRNSYFSDRAEVERIPLVRDQQADGNAVLVANRRGIWYILRALGVLGSMRGDSGGGF